MKKVLKYISLVLALPLLVTSCLKDDELIGPDADGSVSNIIEFGNIAAPSSGVTSSYPLYIQAYDIAQSKDLNIPIKVVGKYENPGDVKVVVELDNSILTKYNEENETEYVPLPTEYFSIPSTEIVIPSDKRSTDFIIKLFTDKFDFDNSYALGLKIKSVSNGIISGNFGAIAVAVSAKNALDGSYTFTGTMTDVTNSAFKHGSTMRNYTVELHTVGPNEVAMFDPYAFGDYIYPFHTGTGWSGYGSFAPVFKFDLATNKIIGVTNYFGQPASNTRSAQLDPDGINTYDPSTKTISVSYFMIQPNSVATSPHIRTRITEVFKYTSSR